MNLRNLGIIWKKYFEYDRVAEKKILKSIRLWNEGNIVKKIYAMFLYNKIRKVYNCSINPRIKIGNNLYISHAQDILIGQTSIIGDNCRIYPGAKLIAKVNGDNELVKKQLRRHPKIGNNCILGTDCIIIGAINIGDNVTIGAGTIVTKDVPNNCTVIETNKIIKKKKEKF